MDKTRRIKLLFKSRPTLEGAGVHLKRVFGYHQVPLFDPFLLLDDFHSDRPEEYEAGFPWHPHRGIETITYVLQGQVAHGDSMGNQGVIGAGDVQWMTAGSGIVHQEMPKGDAKKRLWGFQLWANLPASHKMTAPRYRGITAQQIPVVEIEEKTIVRLICGNFRGHEGPVGEVMIDPEYLDVQMRPGAVFSHPAPHGHTVFAYMVEGRARFDSGRDEPAGTETLILYGDGAEVRIEAAKEGARFLLVSGRPLGEPVAWAGPIAINTQAELDTAFAEYRQGTFLKQKSVNP